MSVLDVFAAVLFIIVTCLAALVIVDELTRRTEAHVRLRNWRRIRQEREEKAVWAFLSSLPRSK